MAFSVTAWSTRDRIVAAADELIYRQGYEHTSFAAIADAVKISRGNFYHHFRTKDAILASLIDLRLEKTRQMLAQWEAQGRHPEDRILCFIQILIANRARIARYGCPVGTLSAELAKLDHGSRDQANAVFTLFRSWLRRQFATLCPDRDADGLAMHLLARSQGVATLAGAVGDEDFIGREVAQLRGWVKACAQGSDRAVDPAGQV